MSTLPLAAGKAPDIDWAALSPLLALLGGAVVVLLVGLLRSRFAREQLVPFLSLVTFAVTIGLTIWELDETGDIISGALRIDGLSTVITLLICAGGVGVTLLSWRAAAPRESAHGEFFALLLTSAAGMVVLAWSQNLVSVFLGFELLSIPLYVLCATEMRRATSLESGLKYLIVGSVGSATLLYGLAFLYGATGSTDFSGIAAALEGDDGIATDPLLLTGIALSVVGLAFKASVAPFHQWTPDVYEGAPTAVTAWMAVATKVAAFGIFLRLFDVALIEAQPTWAPALAVLATITIIVGNVGALGQSSLKRILAYSSVAQAGYMLAGVVVSTSLGVRATIFYLAGYTLMTLAAFAVIIAQERRTAYGDDIRGLDGLGADKPSLAWPMTIAMLGLAGIPATVGFIGKFELIRATVDGGWTWLGIVIVVGSMISLAYYLRIVAAMWMRPTATAAPVARAATAPGGRPLLAGGSNELDDVAPTRPAAGATGLDDEGDRARGSHLEVTVVAALCGAASLVLGVVPQPLFDLVERCGSSLTNLV